MKTFSLFLTLFISASCFAQKHDNTWLSSSGGEGFDLRNQITFTSDALKLDSVYYTLRGGNATYSISDDSGNLQFLTNGFDIFDSSFRLMENGSGLNDFNVIRRGFPTGMPVDQSVILLPDPNDNFCYYILHSFFDTREEFPYVFNEEIRATKIDMRKNNGLGSVIEKNKIIIKEDNLLIGGLTATKHGNGRDWWIFIPARDTNLIYRMLLDPNGVTDFGHVQVDSIVGNVDPVIVFSPDGSKLAFWWGENVSEGHNLDLYDFDRCTGNFNNHKRFRRFESRQSSTGGIAFSPSGRYLYMTNTIELYQLDMEDSDPISSRVLIDTFDGFWDFDPLFHASFRGMQLAPNGTIGVFCNSGVRTMHWILDPDSSGVKCNFVQHPFILPSTSTANFPNFPNYRLSALPCSSCDTLRGGITPLVITQQPTSIDLCQNEPLNFEIQCNRAANFQWYVANDPVNWVQIIDGEDYAGSTTSTLRLLKDASAYKFLRFRCEVGDSCNQFQSETVELFYGQDLPIADFDITQIQDSIIFTNQSTGYQNAQWFYDNQTGSLNEFSHVFSAAGNYDIGLIVQNACGEDTTNQSIMIPALSGNFSINQMAACAPVIVTTSGWANAFRANEFTYRFETNGFSQTLSGKDVQIQLDQPGIYDVTLEIKTASGETFSIKKENAVEVFGSNLTEVTETICPNESYELNGITYSIPDDYEIILKSKNGCDSIVQLHLIGLPERDTLHYLDLCEGDSYQFGNQTIRSEGIYEMMHQATNGCDSIERLSVSLVPQIRVPIERMLCWGESITIGNQTFDQTGNYEIGFQTLSGCDSIVDLSLEILPLPSGNVGPILLCEGEAYAIGDSTFNESGIHFIILEAENGCDSLLKVILVYQSASEENIDSTICQGESIMVGNQVFEQAGGYEILTQNRFGCDSTINLNLEILQDTIQQLFFETCKGEAIIFNDTTLTESGVYDFSFSSPNFCDSIVQVHITVLEDTLQQLFFETCEGEAVIFNDTTLSESGVYDFNYPSSNFCDSTVQVHLTVFQTYSQSQFDTICQNEQLIYAGDTITQSGIYDFQFSTIENCDSTVQLNVEVLDEYFVAFDTTIVKGTTFEGHVFERDSTISKLLTASNGCDSLVVIHLMVETSSSKNIEIIEGISVYPNPVSEILYIETNFDSPEDLNIQLTDLLGRPIEQFKQNSVLQSTFQLDISKVTQGIYLLVFNTKEGRAVRKIIKN